MTIEGRLARLERARRAAPTPGRATPLEIRDATDVGHWGFAEWREEIGEQQLLDVRKEIQAGAVTARNARSHGDPQPMTDALKVAMGIVSYLPTEEVPTTYAHLLDGYLRRHYAPVELDHLALAVAAAIILDTRDGMALRRKLWHRFESDND